jgi:hypothetical protein
MEAISSRAFIRDEALRPKPFRIDRQSVASTLEYFVLIQIERRDQLSVPSSRSNRRIQCSDLIACC